MLDWYLVAKHRTTTGIIYNALWSFRPLAVSSQVVSSPCRNRPLAQIFKLHFKVSEFKYKNVYYPGIQSTEIQSQKVRYIVLRK